MHFKCFDEDASCVLSLWHLAQAQQPGVSLELCHACSSSTAIELFGRFNQQNGQQSTSEMAKNVRSPAESKRKRQKSRSIPLEQVSPAVLTATRDVAYTLEQLAIMPGPEDVLKAVLDRAAHLEEQASGITLFED